MFEKKNREIKMIQKNFFIIYWATGDSSQRPKNFSSQKLMKSVWISVSSLAGENCSNRKLRLNVSFYSIFSVPPSLPFLFSSPPLPPSPVFCNFSMYFAFGLKIVRTFVEMSKTFFFSFFSSFIFFIFFWKKTFDWKVKKISINC